MLGWLDLIYWSKIDCRRNYRSAVCVLAGQQKSHKQNIAHTRMMCASKRNSTAVPKTIIAHSETESYCVSVR